MDAVGDIKARLAIEDVVGEYVELKKTGRNFKGLSPFTSEKTPSFVVSPEKEIWHDFSSNKGGDLFSFVMEMEGLDFKGALEVLARKAGVDLSQYQSGGSSGNQKQKEQLYKILDLAAKFYQVQLKNYRPALEYIFKTRRFSKKVAIDFRLGYAPESTSALADFLIKRGFTKAEIKAAGLINERSGMVSDMFRGRIMVPLMDQVGQIVGFTARILQDNPKAPKYINTPATILYDKSRHVFGLNLAKEAIRQDKFAVVVEGNLDVVASHQAGVTNVVAAAGTALTEQHLKILSRLTQDIRLSFDQDSAGIAATERAIPLASKTGVSVSIITVQEGKDPDELIRQDPKLWQKAINSSEYALDWLMQRYEKQIDLKTAEGKRKFSDVLVPTIRQLADSVEQDHYVKVLAEKLDVGEEALRQKVASVKTGGPKKTPMNRSAAVPTGPDLNQIKFQNQLMALCLAVLANRGLLKDLIPEMLDQEPAKTLLSFLHANPDFKDDPEKARALSSVADYVKMLGLQFEEFYGGVDAAELQHEAARLRNLVIKHYVAQQKTKLADALKQASSKHSAELFAQAKQLDQLLKRTYET